MEDLKTKFNEIHGIDVFTRIVPEHILPIYIGIDDASRYSLFIIANTAPSAKVDSSSVISIYIGTRKDGKYGITFSLNNEKFFDQFVCFCQDIISSSANVGDAKYGADFVCARYIQWQKLFLKNKDGFLSQAEIKGLLGEMCFLLNKMIPKYGEYRAVASWCGPEMSDRDFEIDDTWYEVKSTVSGSASVRISSIEQLDTINSGHLVITYLDKTSITDANRLTLNNVYKMICNSISSDTLKIQLDTTLLSLGYYPNQYYDQFCYKYSGMSSYSVTREFPCARRSDLPIAVSGVKYDLSLAAIQQFKEE